MRDVSNLVPWTGFHDRESVVNAIFDQLQKSNHFCLQSGHEMRNNLTLLISLAVLTLSAEAFIPSISGLVRVFAEIFNTLHKWIYRISDCFYAQWQFRRNRSPSADSSHSALALRCSTSDDSNNPKIIKLGTTKTSWQGWGTTTVKKGDLKVCNSVNLFTCLLIQSSHRVRWS